MFDLELIKKANEIEKQTGKSVIKILGQVPFSNVVTAFNCLEVSDLVEMVLSVPLNKLVYGLQIITAEEIEKINPEKLKLILKHSDMLTVEKLQKQFGSRTIIIAVNKLSNENIIELLTENNYKKLIDVICENGYIN